MHDVGRQIKCAVAVLPDGASRKMTHRSVIPASDVYTGFHPNYGFLNKLAQIALSRMTVTGPMKTQPVERASNATTPVLPMMPTGQSSKNTPEPKKKRTRTEAVRVAKAKITRRNSLRKQREALRG
jgi:hypothetical protein